jgi:acyl carrier protein
MATDAAMLIEKFGFPVFVALCGLLLFAAVWRFFVRELRENRISFLEHIQQRDRELDHINQRINSALNRNSLAFIELRVAIERHFDIDNQEIKQIHVSEPLDEPDK